MVFSAFGNSCENMNYYQEVINAMTLEDQFFLTLVRLRLNKPHWLTAALFKIKEKDKFS